MATLAVSLLRPIRIFGAADINFVANHNTINHWDTGLDIFQCSPSCTGSNFNNVVASNNTITNNNIGILVEGGQITGPIAYRTTTTFKATPSMASGTPLRPPRS